MIGVVFVNLLLIRKQIFLCFTFARGKLELGAGNLVRLPKNYATSNLS